MNYEKNPLKTHYKIIVIGAGPSGLSTTLNLLNSGEKDVLIIEKNIFPRYKCCAGYITEKTKNEYKRLGLDVEKCHYSKIKDFDIYYKSRKKLRIDNKFLYTNRNIDRVELDNAFFEFAVSRGISVLQNTCIKNHVPKENKLELSDGKTVNYDILIFADGTSGFGSRYQKNKKKNIAMQLIFKSDKEQSIAVHLGHTKRGYGWASTCNGIINIGLTDEYNPKINYRKTFTEFMTKLGYSSDTTNLTGAFTPIGIRKPVLFGNVFFVGDAVGACDPLTLSGLRYALKSGEMCAKAIAENNSGIYKTYIRKLGFQFALIRIFMKLFYLKPVLYCGINIFCKFFGNLTASIFNRLFVNKK